MWPKLKLLQKLKIYLTWFGVHSLELLAANSRSFQATKRPVRYLAPFQRKGSLFEPMRAEASLKRNKSLAYTKTPEKTESL